MFKTPIDSTGILSGAWPLFTATTAAVASKFARASSITIISVSTPVDQDKYHDRVNYISLFCLLIDKVSQMGQQGPISPTVKRVCSIANLQKNKTRLCCTVHRDKQPMCTCCGKHVACACMYP